MTTIRNLRPLPTLPADNAGRAQWLAANGPVKDHKPIAITIDPVAWVSVGGDIDATGQLVVTAEQRQTLQEAAYANDGKLSGAEAIAALQAKRDADQAECSKVYGQAKALYAQGKVEEGNALIRTVRKHGYPPDDVMDAKHEALESVDPAEAKRAKAATAKMRAKRDGAGR